MPQDVVHGLDVVHSPWLHGCSTDPAPWLQLEMLKGQKLQGTITAADIMLALEAYPLRMHVLCPGPA